MEGYAKIPIGELTLREAVNVIDDPSWWDKTLPPILLHYRISPSEYWELTVYQHRLLYDWLVGIGVVKDGEQPET